MNYSMEASKKESMLWETCFHCQRHNSGNKVGKADRPYGSELSTGVTSTLQLK